MTDEIFETQVNYLGKGLYGCRVFYKHQLDKPICELRVTKSQISTAFYDMFRTLDKLGYMSPMAHASRSRDKFHPQLKSKYIWYR